MVRIYSVLRLAFIAGLSVVACNPPSQAQVQVSLEARKDNTLYESASGAISNGAGQALFVGRTGQLSGSIRRGLVAFAVTDSIPQGATVLNVTMTLHMSRTGLSATSANVELHRAFADWGEGASDATGNEGSGAPAATNDATWLHRFFDTATWTNPGGDFTAQSSAAQSVNGVGSYTWESTSQLVKDVQHWVDDPASNFGWVILGDEGTASTTKRFDTKENIDPTVRPRLTVTYSSVLASTAQQSLIPATPALQQNFPNPFNPSTSIGFQVPGMMIGSGVSGPGSSLVRLAVYDLLGREVAVLVDEQMTPGSHTVTWNASGMASGVYLYRIVSGDFIQSRKMVLMK